MRESGHCIEFPAGLVDPACRAGSDPWIALMLDRGKYLIVFVVLLAFAAAGFSVWFRIEQGRRGLALWGAEHAARIRNAPQVELMRLESGEGAVDKALTDPQGKKWIAAKSVEVGSIPDFVHVRRALLDDSFFEQPVS